MMGPCVVEEPYENSVLSATLCSKKGTSGVIVVKLIEYDAIEITLHRANAFAIISMGRGSLAEDSYQ